LKARSWWTVGLGVLEDCACVFKMNSMIGLSQPHYPLKRCVCRLKYSFQISEDADINARSSSLMDWNSDTTSYLMIPSPDSIFVTGQSSAAF
jgi:hypothetical protein